jgi:hypothetical protein
VCGQLVPLQRADVVPKQKGVRYRSKGRTKDVSLRRVQRASVKCFSGVHKKKRASQRNTDHQKFCPGIEIILQVNVIQSRRSFVVVERNQSIRQRNKNTYHLSTMATFFDNDDLEWSDSETDDKPLSFDEAIDTIIQFGKHKGKSIGKLVRSSKGRSYMSWCIENFENMFDSTKAAMILVLSEYEKAKARRS